MAEQLRFDNRVVIVTGAGNGLGRAHALLFASRGAKVVVNDLGGSSAGDGASHRAADVVVNEIKAAGGEAVANYNSVADGAAVVQTALDAFGRVDVVVNNAGILRDAIFHKMTEADFDAVVAVNLKGPFNVARAAATPMREQGGGRMLHMTSTSGLIGNFGQANYAAAKLGVAGLSRSIALDMARFGVTSNAIAPFAWSRMTGTIPINSEADRIRVERMRAMTPAKVAALAVALAADGAAQVSGQIFSVRGNEIFLYSQPRPIRALARLEGWTPQDVLAHALPAFAPSFTPLERSADVFCWDPV